MNMQKKGAKKGATRKQERCQARNSAIPTAGTTQNRQPIAIPNAWEPPDECGCLHILVEDLLTTTQRVVHVVHAALYEVTILLRHIL